MFLPTEPPGQRDDDDDGSGGGGDGGDDKHCIDNYNNSNNKGFTVKATAVTTQHLIGVYPYHFERKWKEIRWPTTKKFGCELAEAADDDGAEAADDDGP